MSTKFGWCLPGIEQHSDCIVSISWNGDVLCDCDCHAKNAVEYLSDPEPETETPDEEHNG